MDAGAAPFAVEPLFPTSDDDAPSARGLELEQRRRRRGASCRRGWGLELALAQGLGLLAQQARADEHDVSTEGAGWRSPTLWGSLVIIISAAMGMALSKVYRERMIPVCLKFPIGQRSDYTRTPHHTLIPRGISDRLLALMTVHSLVPVLFALVLMGFYFEAGLYLIMDGESGVWHVIVGFLTLVGGSYYSWYVYMWSLPDEARLIESKSSAIPTST